MTWLNLVELNGHAFNIGVVNGSINYYYYHSWMQGTMKWIKMDDL